MSIVIQQSKEQTKMSFSLHSRADIGEIWLVESSVSCSRHTTDPTGDLDFKVGYSVGETDFKKGALRTKTSFALKIIKGVRKQREIISIECVFGAEYILMKGFKPTPEEIDAFRQANVVFNCWPYFREYANNTLARMGFSHLPIPFLRLVPKVGPSPADSEKQEPTKSNKGIRSRPGARARKARN